MEEEGEGVVLGFGEHAGEGGEDGDGDLDDHAPGFGREFLFHRTGCWVVGGLVCVDASVEFECKSTTVGLRSTNDCEIFFLLL